VTATWEKVDVYMCSLCESPIFMPKGQKKLPDKCERCGAEMTEKPKTGRGKPMELAGVTYPRKKDVEARAKQILRDTPVHACLEGDDRAFMVALLNHHYLVKEKIGSGVKDIFVGKQPGRDAKRFLLRRTNGVIVDFSYRKCLRPPTRREHFAEACRAAVQGQVDAFKTHAFRPLPVKGDPTADVFTFDPNRFRLEPTSKVPCALTGELVSWKECHVDHAPPNEFAKIVDDYIKEHQIDINQIQLLGAEDGFSRRCFQYEEERRFAAFHKERAVLQIVAIAPHMERSYASRRKG